MASFGFNAAPAEERIHGNPKSIRVEKEDYSGDAKARYLAEVGEYDRAGHKTSFQYFRPDGSLSCHELYEYAENGRLLKVRRLDELGAEIGVEEIYTREDGLEERVVRDREGRELNRIVNRFDDGLLVETSSSDASGRVTSVFSLQYDNSRQPIAGSMISTSKDGSTSKITLRLDADSGRVIATYVGLSEVVTFESEAVTDGTDLSKISTYHGDSVIQTNAQRIEAWDEHGNWTRLALFLPRPEHRRR